MCTAGAGRLFLSTTNFVDFGDFYEICFTVNQRKFYRDTDCRLKRKHQCRLVKMVSSNFPFTKFVALEKAPYGIMRNDNDPPALAFHPENFLMENINSTKVALIWLFAGACAMQLAMKFSSYHIQLQLCSYIHVCMPDL